MHVYFIDELAEVTLVVIALSVASEKEKVQQEEFVRFISVRVY